MSGFFRAPLTKVLLFTAVVSTCFSLACSYSGKKHIPEGPSTALYEVTRTLWEHGSLESAYAKRIFEQASLESKRTNSVVEQDIFAISRDGRLYPKHSLFSAVAAVPFYGLFGAFGYWLFQQLSVVALVCGLFSICQDLKLGSNDDQLTRAVIISSLFLTQTLLFSYDFSYEVHATALVVAGLAMQKRFPLLAGITMGLSLFVRANYLLVALPLAFTPLMQTGRSSGFLKVLSGVLLCCVLVLVANTLMWGGPFEFSYTRLIRFENGELRPYDHPQGFVLSEIFTDIGEKLFGKNGILPANLSILALPWVLRSAWQHPERKVLSYWLLIALAFTIYVFSYSMWNSSPVGNRFLFPALMLYLIPFSLYFATKLRR